jgi:hypothetical protein
VGIFTNHRIANSFGRMVCVAHRAPAQGGCKRIHPAGHIAIPFE